MRSGRIFKKINFDTKCIYSGRETQNPFEGLFAHHNFCLKNIHVGFIYYQVREKCVQQLQDRTTHRLRREY